MFWVIEYAPKKIEELDLFPFVNERLKKISDEKIVHNYIFYGKKGSGKYTRAKCMLRNLFGDEITKTKLVKKKVALKKSFIEINVIYSLYHMEINLSGNVNDSIILKEIVESIPDCNFYVILVKNAQDLSEKAQSVICNFLDKNLNKCKFLFCCTERIFNKKIFSYCVPVRIPLPSEENLKMVINKVAEKERMELNEEYLNQLIEKSGFNIKKALMFLQASCIKGEPHELILPEWETDIKSLCDKLKNKKITVASTRRILHSLLISNVPIETILEQIIYNFLGSEKELELIDLFEKYKIRADKGQKTIYHLEAFVMEILICLKNKKKSC